MFNVTDQRRLFSVQNRRRPKPWLCYLQRPTRAHDDLGDTTGRNARASCASRGERQQQSQRQQHAERVEVDVADIAKIEPQFWYTAWLSALSKSADLPVTIIPDAVMKSDMTV